MSTIKSTTPSDWPMYVDADGQYGSAWETRQFQYDALNDKQWEMVEVLDGYDRFRYISAVLDNDADELAYFEEEE